MKWTGREHELVEEAQRHSLGVIGVSSTKHRGLETLWWPKTLTDPCFLSEILTRNVSLWEKTSVSRLCPGGMSPFIHCSYWARWLKTPAWVQFRYHSLYTIRKDGIEWCSKLDCGTEHTTAWKHLIRKRKPTYVWNIQVTAICS